MSAKDLCEVCSKIVLTLPTNNTLIRSYADKSSLDTSADTGCFFCSLIRSSHQYWHSWKSADNRITRDPHTTKHSSIEVYHRFSKEFDLESNIKWECREESPGFSSSLGHALGGFYANVGDSAARDFQGRPVEAASETSVRAIFELARQWLLSCTTSHDLCRAQTASFQPTRLLDVSEREDNTRVRLITTAKDAQARYVALSYCWGSARQVTLTRDNLEGRTDSIIVDDLPRTIQDAIEVTRQLGFKYLWIDALCIIQDDPQDWEIESSRMGSVYNQAQLTIQADRASHCNEGFLKRSQSTELPPARLQYRGQDGSTGHVYVRQRPLIDTSWEEPLKGRGWAMQEALLSPRTLAFGTTQVSWECRTCFKSEGGSLLKEHGVFRSLPKPVRSKWRYSDIPMALGTTDQAAEERLLWSYVVRDYVARQLTFEKDKLPAISGVARFLAERRQGGIYLAGLWRNELPETLLWGPSSVVTKPTMYRAPTWAWPSLEGNIVTSDRAHESASAYCEVVDGWTTQAGLDQFGEVRDGRLTLSAQLKVAWRILDQETAEAGDPEVQYLYPSDRRLLPSDRKFALKLGLCQVDIVDPNQELDLPVPTYLLRITRTDGLALIPVAGGMFERMGTFGLDDDKVEFFNDSSRELVTIV